MWARVALIAGSFYGLTGVVLGAMAAHALKATLTAKQLASFQTGTRYQMMHAVLLIALGLLSLRYRSRLLSVCVGLICAGVLCFSGSIYLLNLVELGALKKVVGPITPIGGLMMIVGWGCLMVFSWQLPAAEESQTSN